MAGWCQRGHFTKEKESVLRVFQDIFWQSDVEIHKTITSSTSNTPMLRTMSEIGAKKT